MLQLHEWRVAAFIAARYFFSRKHTHAVNIIAIVSVVGIAVVAMAMVSVLSVFNGFERFALSQLSSTSAAYRITQEQQQIFDADSLQEQLGITDATPILSSPVIINYGANHVVAQMVGVGQGYTSLVGLSDFLFEGDLDALAPDSEPLGAVLDFGLSSALGAMVGGMEPLEIVVPKRQGRVSITMPAKGFRKEQLPITGIVRLDQPENPFTLFVPISVAQRLLQRTPRQAEALLLASAPSKAPSRFIIEDRVQQHPDIFKVVRVEKWVSFALLLFVLLLSLFSVISTLGMLIIEKRSDMRTLSVLGARPALLSQVIHLEGWILSITGLAIGMFVGVVLVLLQEQFGFVRMGSDSGAFLLDAYPVALRISDLVGITIVILLIGWGSSKLAQRIFMRDY